MSATWESEIAYNHGVIAERERVLWKIAENIDSVVEARLAQLVSGIEENPFDINAFIKGENK